MLKSKAKKRQEDFQESSFVRQKTGIVTLTIAQRDKKQEKEFKRVNRDLQNTNTKTAFQTLNYSVSLTQSPKRGVSAFFFLRGHLEILLKKSFGWLTFKTAPSLKL